MNISNKEFETIFKYWFYYGVWDANWPEIYYIISTKSESKNFIEFIERLIKCDKETQECEDGYVFECFICFIGHIIVPPEDQTFTEKDYTLEDITKIKTKIDNYIEENSYSDLLYNQ